jgi:hypothetical protein
MTQLWGNIKDKDQNRVENISVADELEYDRKHWVDEFAVTFPIGIDVTEPEYGAPGVDSAGKATPGRMTGYKAPQWSTAYGVAGFPTFYLIDRKGIVRRILVGASKLEETISAEIEKLLAEKVTGAP